MFKNIKTKQLINDISWDNNSTKEQKQMNIHGWNSLLVLLINKMHMHGKWILA